MSTYSQKPKALSTLELTAKYMREERMSFADAQDKAMLSAQRGEITLSDGRVFERDPEPVVPRGPTTAQRAAALMANGASFTDAFDVALKLRESERVAEAASMPREPAFNLTQETAKVMKATGCTFTEAQDRALAARAETASTPAPAAKVARTPELLPAAETAKFLSDQFVRNHGMSDADARERAKAILFGSEHKLARRR